MDDSGHMATMPTKRMRRSVVVVAVAAMTLLAGCAAVAFAVPQSVISVPGSYTFTIPSGAPDIMGPGGQVVVCSDTQSYLYVQVSEEGLAALSWTSFDGTPADSSLVGPGTFPDGYLLGAPDFGRTADPLPPGCGKLTYAAHNGNPAPYVGPPTATVWISRTAPTP